MFFKMFLVLFLCSFVLVVSCVNNNNETTIQNETNIQPQIFFPTQKEKPDIVMQLLLQGELTRDNQGCLRVHNELIIWPYKYSYVIEDNFFWILNKETEKIFKVGDFVKIGGGEINKQTAEAKTGNSFPVNCEGPFWLAGEILN